MEKQFNSLALKANRMLGANLVQARLISPGDLEKANEEYIRQRSGNDPIGISLLKILLFDLQSLSEEKLLAHQIEQHGLGVLHLNRYQVQESCLPKTEAGGLHVCRATSTVPIDSVSDIHFLATSYYLSPFVRQYWTAQLEGDLVWYAVPFQEMTMWLEQARLAAEKAAADAVPAKKAPAS
jgi:hypothetical protein